MARRSGSSIDEELSQSLARAAICVVAMGYLGGLWVFGSAPKRALFFALLFYTLFTLVWAAWIKRAPGRHSWRRYVVIVGDLAINSFFFYMLGPTGVVFYPFFLWIVVGNGMRFGAQPLVVSMCLSLISFSAVIYFSDYWRANALMGFGLGVGLIILPLFYLKLIRRLFESNRQLQVELARSQEASRAKARFLANMSHELRTPMNGILGISRLMTDTPLNTQQQEWLRVIHESTTALLHVINDILDFSKIDADKLTLETVDFNLKEVVFNVYSLLALEAESKGLSLNVRMNEAAPSHFRGDATRVRQILYNLVGNAVKFTDRGGVSLDYDVAPLDGGRVLVKISVADTGIGIPREKLGKIFEQFEQVETQLARPYGGTGLGLAISQRLAKLMGGEIEVVSELDCGSKFTLALPFEPVSATVMAKRERQKPKRVRRYGYKALLAEDDRVSQMVAKGQLQNLLGIEVDIAGNGAEALGLLAKGDYDLVFMDVQMPEIDGLTAARDIRAGAGGKPDIPIVALTANASVEDRQRCREAGMDAHVKKPVTPEEMAAALDALIAEKRLPRPHGRGASEPHCKAVEPLGFTEE